MTPPFDTRQVRRAFSRAAARYREHAVLQREVEDRLLERLDYVTTPPQRVLDVGAGPGRASAALRRRWPKAEVIALDQRDLETELCGADGCDIAARAGAEHRDVEGRRVVGRGNRDRCHSCGDYPTAPLADG